MHIGFTSIHDESATNDPPSRGSTRSIEVLPGITLKGEMAQSESVDDSDGSAWRLELEHRERSQYRLYHRTIGSKFDNESMSGDRSGMTTMRFGANSTRRKLGGKRRNLSRDRQDRRAHPPRRHQDFTFKKDSREFTIGLGYTHEENISNDKDAGEKLRSPFVRLGTAFNSPASCASNSSISRPLATRTPTRAPALPPT